MLNKSLIYKEAAMRLLSMEKYAPSVSMFYYAALQKTMYVCAKKLTNGIQYKDQTRPEVDTHKCVSECVARSINRKERDNFKDIFGKFHDLRKMAEYGPISITKDMVAEARNYFELIEGYLNRNFGIRQNI